MKTFPINMVSDLEAEVLLYDAIGFDPETGEGTSAKGFAEALAALGPVNQLTIRINSGGGDVFEGMAIYNAIARHSAKVITVKIDGIAASAASFIAMAGDRIEAAENSQVMIHRARGLFYGTTQEAEQFAGILRNIDNSISGVYASRTGRKAETFLRMMDGEKWMSAEEAMQQRLVDFITPNKGKPLANVIPVPAPRMSLSDWMTVAASFQELKPRRLMSSVSAEAAPEEETDLELDDEEVESPLNLQATLDGYAARAAEVTA